MLRPSRSLLLRNASTLRAEFDREGTFITDTFAWFAALDDHSTSLLHIFSDEADMYKYYLRLLPGGTELG